jgi:hypothetical protein
MCRILFTDTELRTITAGLIMTETTVIPFQLEPIFTNEDRYPLPDQFYCVSLADQITPKPRNATPVPVKLDTQDISVILGALRLMQLVPMPESVADQVTGYRRHRLLTNQQIDDLCMRINFGG